MKMEGNKTGYREKLKTKGMQVKRERGSQAETDHRKEF